MKRMMKAVSVLLVVCLVVVASIVGCAKEEEKKVNAGFTAEPTSGTVPLEVQFTDQSTGEVTDWEWDFDNNGTVDSTEQNPTHTYATVGKYTVSLTVTGPEGSDTETKVDYIEVSQKELKIGVIGPMAYIQGQHHWYGATLAAEEINAAGGIMVGDESYRIKLVQMDSNEILSVTDASAAMERLITVENVDFVVGGFRTESVLAMQDVAMDHEMIFLVCGASIDELCERVADDYDTYKYTFRVTPVNGTNLAKISFMLTGMVAQQVGALTYPEPPKIAILAENMAWADPLVASAQAYFAAPPPYGMGLTVVGTWRPSQTATDVTIELDAIEAAGANIIYTVVSGPLGVACTSQWGQNQIPAASVGINVEAQKGDFLDVTGGYGAYETTLNTYARVEITDETIDFFDTFVDRFGEIPIYTAGTYDALYILKDAIERADSLDNDAVVTALEATDLSGPAGRMVFMGTDEDTPHDVTWGPGYVTGIGVQWQDEELVCVWPYPIQALGVVYEGTVPYVLPPWVVTALTE
jgi:branched-chain amino acid transport system substrate-binding protein